MMSICLSLACAPQVHAEEPTPEMAGQSSELKGTYGLNDKGLLVLTSDDTEMVSALELKNGGNMHFVLIGAPVGDPGLDFVRN